MTAELMDSRVAGLLGEAAEWRLLGLLFEYPTAQWRAQVSTLLPDLRTAEMREMAEGALEQASEGLHIALFGPAGTTPAREAAYAGGVQLGYLMSELAAYYEAFGYKPVIEEAEDHVSVEAGFVAYLRLKQAAAVACGDDEHAGVTADAARTFVKDHLAVIAEPLAKKLEMFAPEFLVEAGRSLFRHAGEAPKTAYPLGGLVCDEDSEAMTCGDAPEGGDLIQLEP
jgi:nitrate reductase assembly molybdenum cofactor insertion protein NarJ